MSVDTDRYPRQEGIYPFFAAGGPPAIQYIGDLIPEPAKRIQARLQVVDKEVADLVGCRKALVINGIVGAQEDDASPCVSYEARVEWTIGTEEA